MFFSKNKDKGSFDWMVAGLGNPGYEYSGNRHNIGKMVAEALCERFEAVLDSSPSLYSKAILKIFGNKVLVTTPNTFMNTSGLAVAKAANKNDIPTGKIIVIVDEYNFPVGRVHLKMGGSDGGHNGISSIIDGLGSAGFYRLRCGIDKNFGMGQMADYVLSDFQDNELELRDAMINRAVEAIISICKMGIQRAMPVVNEMGKQN